MKDVERISRLLGAALNECSGAVMDGVRLHVLRAMNALDSVQKKRPSATPAAATEKTTAILMTKEQRDRALESIQSMIDEESEKVRGSERDGGMVLG